MLRNFRKPLIVVAPKVLIRLAAASSTLSEMGPESHFQPVLSTRMSATADEVKRVFFVSGKHFYGLHKRATELGIRDAAFVRLEQLCPFPAKELQDAVAEYRNADGEMLFDLVFIFNSSMVVSFFAAFVWSQEEHRNMGAWSFVFPRFRNLVGISPSYVGRGELCQPAVGVGQEHGLEAEDVLARPFDLHH